MLASQAQKQPMLGTLADHSHRTLVADELPVDLPSVACERTSHLALFACDSAFLVAWHKAMRVELLELLP